VRRINLLSQGGIWLGTAPGIQVERNRFYPTLEKVVRGLYRHHIGRYLPTDTTFNWAINEPLQGERRMISQLSNPGIAYADVFDCRFGIASDDNIEMTVWWLRFYRKLVMRCLTRIGIAVTSWGTASNHAVDPTANSRRSCVAPAIGDGSPRAGFA
jgi:hypothetical protein